MREIIISTESGSDMPDKLVGKYHVQVVPMHVIMNDQSYEDNLDHVDRVFDYFESTGKVPSTSCVNTHEYTEFFRRLQEEHPGCVIYHFAYASVSSGTYQAAKIALDQGEFQDIYLIDTKNVSGGCTAHIIESWKLIHQKAGSDSDPVFLPDDFDFSGLFDELQALADHIECEFIPNTLEYLRAGGRVSNSAFLVANVLNLKPLIEIDRNGALVATKKYRGRMSKIVEKFMPDFINRFPLKRDVLYLMYGKGLPDEVLRRMKQIAQEYGFKHTEYVMTGCVISCHGGKGAIGLAGVTE